MEVFLSPGFATGRESTNIEKVNLPELWKWIKNQNRVIGRQQLQLRHHMETTHTTSLMENSETVYFPETLISGTAKHPLNYFFLYVLIIPTQTIL